MTYIEYKNLTAFNSVKLLEYKPDMEKIGKTARGTAKSGAKNELEKQKSNNQFLRIAKLFEGINKRGGSKEAMPLDLDSVFQCLNLCMAYNL